jgi:hypothetical protein
MGFRRYIADGIDLQVPFPAGLALMSVNVGMPFHLLDTHQFIGLQGGFIHNIEHIV